MQTSFFSILSKQNSQGTMIKELRSFWVAFNKKALALKHVQYYRFLFDQFYKSLSLSF